MAGTALAKIEPACHAGPSRAVQRVEMKCLTVLALVQLALQWAVISGQCTPQGQWGLVTFVSSVFSAGLFAAFFVFRFLWNLIDDRRRGLAFPLLGFALMVGIVPLGLVSEGMVDRSLQRVIERACAKLQPGEDWRRAWALLEAESGQTRWGRALLGRIVPTHPPANGSMPAEITIIMSGWMTGTYDRSTGSWKYHD